MAFCVFYASYQDSQTFAGGAWCRYCHKAVNAIALFYTDSEDG